MSRVSRFILGAPVPLLVCLALSAVASADPPGTRPAAAAEDVGAPAGPALGPDLVILDQLVDLYQPVPFNHKSHAAMAEMWDGCATCHHRPPDSPESPGEHPNLPGPGRQGPDEVPPCRSCHEVSGAGDDIRRPSLKGAYHRQCLNCHREWSGQNDCVVCHAPRAGTEGAAARSQPPRQAADDIVGRMHPPIPEPDFKLFRVRVAPVAGPNVLFRHRQHVQTFGVACSACHRRDTCSDCHAGVGNVDGSSAGAGDGGRRGPQPMQIGRTWQETHVPCTTCHAEDRCATCHYRDDQPAPAAFQHVQVGQELDEDHAHLPCGACHLRLKTKGWPSCGDATCHPRLEVAFPMERPGPMRPRPGEDLGVAVNPPGLEVGARPSGVPAAATRPTVIRIRRGGT